MVTNLIFLVSKMLNKTYEEIQKKIKRLTSRKSYEPTNNVSIKHNSSPAINNRSVQDLQTPSIVSNINRSMIVGTMYIRLSILLNNLSALNGVIDSNGLLTLSYLNSSMKTVTFKIPTQNFSKYFTINNFNANYTFVFKTNFPQQIKSTLFPNLKIIIENDLPFNDDLTLDPSESKSFSFLVCLFFGLIYNLKLDTCACYPSNESELSAIQSNIGLNCVSLECKNLLLQNPALFDPLIMSECTQYNMNAAFVSIAAFAGNNITFQNMQINQVIDCISANSDQK